MDLLEKGKKELMCFKCLGKAAISVGALYQMGYLSASLDNPLSFLAPFGIVFASSLIVDLAVSN